MKVPPKGAIFRYRRVSCKFEIPDTLAPPAKTADNKVAVSSPSHPAIVVFIYIIAHVPNGTASKPESVD